LVGSYFPILNCCTTSEFFETRVQILRLPK